MRYRWVMGLVAVLAGISLFVGSPPRPAVAATAVAVSWPTATARSQPAVNVYALPSADGLDATAFAKLQADDQALPPDQIEALVAKLTKVATLQPSQATFAGVAGHAYVLVASGQTQPFATRAWLAPVVIKAQAGLTISLKGSSVESRPYFFKVDEAGTPLAGATFALTRSVAGMREYLTASGWQTSATAALTWTSGSDGLVAYTGPPLAPGDYAFCEVKAPAGYRITQAAQNVALHVPTSGALTLNRVSLAPLVNGHVLAAMARETGLAVVNMRGHPRLPDTDGQPPTTSTTSPPPRQRLWLPQTGEAKAALVAIGLLVIAVALWLWRRVRQ